MWLSLEAIKLSDELIVTLDSARLWLGRATQCKQNFYNHEAVRIWVQRELDNGLPCFGQVSELCGRFMACVNPSDENYFDDKPN